MSVVMDQIRELRRIIMGQVRTGTVDSYDDGAKTVVIEWPEGTKSHAMPYWASAGFDNIPEPGDQATVLAEGGDPKNARAFIGLSTTDAGKGSKTGAARADLVEAELDKIRDAITTSAVGTPPDAGAGYKTNMSTYLTNNARGDVDASKVKID